MHDVAIAFDGETVSDGDASPGGNASDIVAPQVKQHEMLRALLGIGQKLRLVRAVIGFRGTAGAGAGNGSDRDVPVANANQDLRAGAHYGEIGQIEKIEKRRWVHAPQGAVQRQRWQRERAGEALRQHHLKDVAGGDVLLRLGDHFPILRSRNLRFELGFGKRGGRGSTGGQWAGQPGQRGLDPLPRRGDCIVYIIRFPDGGDAEQIFAQIVEDQQECGADEQQIGQADAGIGGAPDILDQSDRFIGEIADHAG